MPGIAVGGVRKKLEGKAGAAMEGLSCSDPFAYSATLYLCHSLSLHIPPEWGFFPRQMVKLGYAKLRWASHVLYMCALGQIPTIYPLNLNLFARFLVLKLKLSKCQGIKQQKENVQISFTLLLTFTILLNISD